MSARAVITMSPEQYLAGLKQLEAATNKSASKMENSFKEYGTSINKAGIAMRYVSAEMGAGAVAFGRAFQVLAGGKIAIAVAAIAGAFTGLKKIMDQITVSDKERSQILDRNIEEGNKEIQQLRQKQTEEDGYLKRLNDLAEREDRTNEEQAEAARLTKILTDRYSELGLSVNKATGEFTDLKSAMKSINDAQKEERLDALATQIANISGRSDALIKNKMKGGWFSRSVDWLNSATGGTDVGKNAGNEFVSKSYTEQLAAAKTLRDEATTEENIRFWSEQVESLTELVNLEKQMNNLKKTGHETTKEETAELQKQSESSRETADAEKSASDAKLAALEKEAEKEAELEKQREKAIEKERQDYAKMLDEQANKRKQLLFEHVNSLKFSAMRAMGKDREADIEEALTGELGMSGIDPKTIIEMVDAKRALAQLQNAQTTSPQMYAPRVNSLIARGGSSAPVKMPEVEKLQMKQLDAQNKANQIAQRILNSLDSWTTY